MSTKPAPGDEVVITSTPLPQETIDEIARAYEAYRNAPRGDRANQRQRLADIAATAHRRNWSWAAFESALAIPGLRGVWLRSLARDIGADQDVSDVAIPRYEMVRTRGGVVQKRTPVPLGDAEREEIATLAVAARRVRGNTPVGHPDRAASERLSALLSEAQARGVTWQDLAGAARMGIAGVRARVARHGYRPAPPSQQPRAYRGVAIGQSTADDAADVVGEV